MGLVRFVEERLFLQSGGLQVKIRRRSGGYHFGMFDFFSELE